jgi:hypothetical protein
MDIETKGKDLSDLFDLYNKEIDTLKSKLLNGIPWEELVTVRRNITELAIAIHKSQNYSTSETLVFGESPDDEES